MLKNVPAPIVFDPNLDFLTTLKPKIGELEVEPYLINTLPKFLEIIKDPTYKLSAIFINPEIVMAQVKNLFNFIAKERPLAAVFLIYDPLFKYDEAEWAPLGIRKALVKPVTLSQIHSYTSQSRVVFDSKSALTAAQSNADTLNTEIAREDEKFSPIRAQDLLMGKTSFFDLYVQLGSKRYIKIVNAGEDFLPERVDSYIKKGVQSFYILKEMQAAYLAYCDNLTSGLLRSSGSADVKIEQTLNHGEETLKFLESNGVDANRLKYASNFVRNVDVLLKQLQPDRYPIVQELLKDAISYDHSVGISMIAAILSQSMSIASSSPVESIGLGCLFHDIGLIQLKMKGFEERESTLTEAERKVFQTHPTVGAEILSQVRGIKPIVLQAVEQHHERRNKKGYPSRIGSGSLSLISEVIGLSDQYFWLLSDLKSGKIKSIESVVNERIFSCFSTTLLQEFTKAFNVHRIVQSDGLS
jgi:putative nucleotidyltransferase with HDIG domain